MASLLLLAILQHRSSSRLALTRFAIPDGVLGTQRKHSVRNLFGVLFVSEGSTLFADRSPIAKGSIVKLDRHLDLARREVGTGW